MKIQLSTLALTSITALSASTLAANLNAPLDDRPTVGSEMNRGFAAAFECNLQNVGSALDEGTCVDRAATAAQQEHSNYKPFELGLFFGEWWHQYSNAKSARSLTDNRFAQESVPEHMSQAGMSFTVFHHLQSELNVTDAQLIDATTTDMNPFGKRSIADSLHEWETNPPSTR